MTVLVLVGDSVNDFMPSTKEKRTWSSRVGCHGFIELDNSTPFKLGFYVFMHELFLFWNCVI